MNKKSAIYSLIAALLSIAVITVAIYFFFIESDSSQASKDQSHPESSLIYGIIIDAGSTGTRILGFEFERNETGFVLKNELWKQLKPGLSSLTPDEARVQITELISEAEHFVPENFWKDTPLKLKATAGFRLLESNRSQEILDAVRQVFKTSKFFTSKDSVEIIDGADEGIYGWFSINYLRQLLSSEKKVAILDLGGGSTQVTFEVSKNLQENLRDFVHRIRNFDGESQLFVKSYLGLGLMALRHAVISKDIAAGELNIASDCINKEQNTFDWKYQDQSYEISPKSADNSTFDDCVIAIRTIVSELMKPKVSSLQDETINAFSYFYDRSVDAQLIKNDNEGDEVKVQSFRQKAVEYCEDRNDKDPWLCLDMTFIYVLLQDGYGLEDEKTIRVFSKINGHEASWALGSFLQDYISKPRRA